MEKVVSVGNRGIPNGFCSCGCGKPTPIAQRTNSTKGHVKGEHTKFCYGHRLSKRKEWIEEDRGYKSPCWIWQLSTASSRGYGRKTARGVTKLAHREIYIRLVGEIPPHLELDHLCRVRSCVNPDHLEPVTHIENVRRGVRDSPTWGPGPAGTSGKSAAILFDIELGILSYNEIAGKHDVHRTYVSAVGRGERGPNSRRVSA